MAEPDARQTALYFKRLLLFEPHVVVTSVPLHLASPEIPAGSVPVPPPEGAPTSR